MSNAKIRTLFTEQLKTTLKQPNGMLKFPMLKDGTDNKNAAGQPIKMTVSHCIVHLIPAPAYSQTLSGDHTAYTGIYQITLKAMSISGGDYNDILEDMTDTVKSAFPINSRLSTTDGFTVQVISPLKTTEARRISEGMDWWQLHAYFDYRADTN